MQSDINEEILKRIDEIKEEDNVKNFIKEALELEYSVNDQSKPNVKKHYDKMVEEFNEW